ncbi:acetyl-CoA carboxylase biotin carboxyl carrier protein [Limosilactobacillus antri]|uniref:Biotin carboxyl carrier protein of acetyl-CoA carboxylase n=1 Tax=Limosilactobacillus antri DSM 16041 TaxID=525309 RepID=C8P650_9LACO|nr:acetyl-CoA carboxylase biotin carboxyl carrier protein [Limosilactobacillus antri]EEW54019.1 acetyl-CoA carboxylase, biotin carboxyl carrier protein [Limosilactobacillus antri DSM 16041]KRK57250.1 acetyl-CoA carboxylase [Limosilactobacillus antri DSM 16041]
MVDTKAIKDLIKLLKDNGLTEIEYSDKSTHIKLKREKAPVVASPQAAPAGAGDDHAQQLKMAAKNAATSNNTINAPSVGVFYTAKSPQEPPFVKVGDRVKKGDVVGVIEVMKTFVNVVADRDGVVEKVLVNNEEGVEYGQPLIQIK